MKKLILLSMVLMVCLAGCGSGEESTNNGAIILPNSPTTYTITTPRPGAASDFDGQIALLQNLGATVVSTEPSAGKITATCADAVVNNYIEQGSWALIVDSYGITRAEYVTIPASSSL